MRYICNHCWWIGTEPADGAAHVESAEIGDHTEHWTEYDEVCPECGSEDIDEDEERRCDVTGCNEPATADDDYCPKHRAQIDAAENLACTLMDIARAQEAFR